MPRVSKYKFRDDKLSELSEHFSYLISSLTNSNDIEDFLNEFLTREEKLMLAKRLVLFMMIKRNYPPYVIQSALHVSYETIRSYSNSISDKTESFHKTLDKLIKREKSKEFWTKVDKILKPLELALSAKTDMKSRAKIMSGDWT